MTPCSRRDLMRLGLGAALATGANVSAANEVSVRQFNLAPNLLYMNAANIAVGFRAGSEAEDAAARDEAANPSAENRVQFALLATALRDRIAAQINVNPAGIALTRNCSEGNVVILQGLRLKAGDEVVIGRENHESNALGWAQRARREGIVVKVLKHTMAPTSAQDLIDAFAAEVTPRTRVVSISHISNLSGLILPAAAIARLAHSVGAWFHLDCAQSYGWMRLDVAALGCDSMAACTQKWLMGPIGSGMLYVRPDRLAEVDPLVPSHGYWRTGSPEDLNGQIFEQIGQNADAKLANFAATLDARARIGDEAIEQRVIELVARLRRQLSAAGVEAWGSGDPSLWGPVVGAMPRGNIEEIQARLWRDHRLAGALKSIDGHRVLRLSPHIYNSDDDIDRVALLLRAS